jgi:hypothetical protein
MWILMLVLLPLTALAQSTFGPLRVDDGALTSFYYARVEPDGPGQIHCTWSSNMDSRFRAEGRSVNDRGNWVGGTIAYEDTIDVTRACVAHLIRAPRADGGEARMFGHS